MTRILLLAIAFIGFIAIIECCGAGGAGADGDHGKFETTTRRKRKSKSRGRGPRQRVQQRRQRIEEEEEEFAADVGSSTWKQFQECQKNFRTKCIERCEYSMTIDDKRIFMSFFWKRGKRQKEKLL